MKKLIRLRIIYIYTVNTYIHLQIIFCIIKIMFYIVHIKYEVAISLNTQEKELKEI